MLFRRLFLSVFRRCVYCIRFDAFSLWFLFLFSSYAKRNRRRVDNCFFLVLLVCLLFAYTCGCIEFFSFLAVMTVFMGAGCICTVVYHSFGHSHAFLCWVGSWTNPCALCHLVFVEPCDCCRDEGLNYKPIEVNPSREKKQFCVVERYRTLIFFFDFFSVLSVFVKPSSGINGSTWQLLVNKLSIVFCLSKCLFQERNFKFNLPTTWYMD